MHCGWRGVRNFFKNRFSRYDVMLCTCTWYARHWRRGDIWAFRCCYIGRSGQTPFGVEHNFFFQKSSIRFRQYAGIRSDREFRGYSMCRLIYWRATLLYIAWFSHYNTIFWHHSDINQIPFWYQFDITLISFLYIKSIFNKIQPQQLITPPFPIPYIRILKRITLIYS